MANPCSRWPTAALAGKLRLECCDAGGKRLSVNVLTAEEPTDWGGGSGLYDAFVEVRPM